MKYRHYDVGDYLTDPRFKDWVRYPTVEKNAFWEEWIRSNPRHREKILQAREIILSMHFHHLEPGEEDYQDVLSHVLKGNKSPHYEEHRKIRYSGVLQLNISVFLRRVAILLLCMIGAVLWVEMDNRLADAPPETQLAYVVKKNPKGQRSIIKLPDGSEVMLNAESEISFQEDFAGSTRKVVLKGEAYFEVARDTLKPFIVQAAGVYTQALGTSFNIKAYHNQETSVEVSLTSGKVEVGDSNLITKNKKLLLRPGEKVVYKEDHFKKEELNYQLDISWKEGTIYFENASFQEVAQRLERWYDVDFVVIEGPFKAWHYDGVFSNSSLKKVLERLAYVQDFTYEKKGRKVYIHFKR